LVAREPRKGPGRAIKALVIGMGVLIAVLAAVIIGELFRRAFLTDETSPPPAPAAVRSVALGLPEGTRIEGLVATGTRVVVHATLPGGGDRLIVLDPQTGAVTAVIAPTAQRQPAAGETE